MKTNKNIRKRTCLIALAMVIAIGVTGVTLAYLHDKTGPVVNTFTPAEIGNHIDEDFDGEVKNNVKVKNTGDVDSYIRADILITWKNEDGNVLGTLPVKGTDYEISQTLTGWKEINGKYYYTEKVAPDGSTSNLIDTCKPLKNAPEKGYYLSVEVLSESIQAEPDTAIKEAWKINPSTWQEVK